MAATRSACKVVPGIYLIRISTSVQASSQKIVMVN